MNLDDREILELNELCNAVVDGHLTERQQQRLAQMLSASPEARAYYVRVMGLSASLHTYASEQQTSHRDAPRAGGPVFRRGAFWWAAGTLAAAAAVTLLLSVARRPIAPPPVEVVQKSKPVEYVARLTAAKGIIWANGSPAAQTGDMLRKGQRLELEAGFAELTFDSGARLVLEGPVSLDVNSAWDTTLRRGVVKAHVPPEAIGFRVTNPAVEVVDLGTEFSMIADGNGAAEVLVLKGEIEATPHNAGEQEPILLREKESLRFAHSGVSDVSDSEKKFARFTAPVSLDRFAAAFHYAHWSFDEPSGGFTGRYSGEGPRDLPTELDGALADVAQARIASQWRQALRFNGQLQVRTTFPGISEISPHTVAFWVRVPEEAPLSDAYAMVAWRASTPRLAYRPVQISWNRNPNEGALGAIRTDFSGGCALGTTSLRDGRWHHVAVVFTPSENTAIPVQVKQYVDGRLESSTIIPGKVRGPAGKANPALNDLVWLGCRLGNSGLRQERFRGEIDELFIADRGLEPQEIVRVMTDNRVPPTAVAAADPAHLAPGTN